MTEQTFSTTLIWHDGTGGECEANVRVTYVYVDGYRGSMEQPPDDASVEIIKIVDASGNGVPDRFLTDDDLIAECMDDWADHLAAAEEFRADCRRDDLMMERF